MSKLPVRIIENWPARQNPARDEQKQEPSDIVQLTPSCRQIHLRTDRVTDRGDWDISQLPHARSASGLRAQGEHGAASK